MARQETFSSRWGLIVAGLGMAVGTGNMWRFPRIAAQNGGAAFLIPWLIFLVTWSLPLLIAEFGIGRGARRGVVGAFADLIGRRYAWMGGFIAVTSVMILFYYSVVTGWTLKYVLAALAGQLDASGAEQYWTDYSRSVWQPLGFHAISVLIGGLIISRGVVAGIERANKVLIPMLLGLLIAAVLRSVTLPGAGRGLGFLFNPDLSLLGSYRTWLEALTQSAWSTGAGWGLILTYAIYMRRDEDVVVNATAIGLGNNTASVLAGMAVVPTAFAILSENQALEAMAAGNTGLTFIWIPQLFARMPGGAVFLPLFFMALFCAALSSLIAMIELATRILMDAGMVRRRAVGWVIGATIVGGAPSAVSLTVFENQDWVWGLALMISGLFVALGATRFGVRRFREDLVNVTGNELNLGRGYEWVLTYLVPIEFAVMFGWWIYQAVAVIDPSGWWSPLRTFSLGTCLLQWGLALVLLVAFNRRIAAASLRGAVETTR
ncbi:MAG: sodium-dependent transporter [Vicinamibacterales bacterium]|jgi:NSS family neurotransmitter:Na+ symporter|nr:sodium-dependent transporter [Vicinamibacterales bacterium]